MTLLNLRQAIVYNTVQQVIRVGVYFNVLDALCSDEAKRNGMKKMCKLTGFVCMATN